jgi:hypothetical protein
MIPRGFGNPDLPARALQGWWSIVDPVWRRRLIPWYRDFGPTSHPFDRTEHCIDARQFRYGGLVLKKRNSTW